MYTVVAGQEPRFSFTRIAIQVKFFGRDEARRTTRAAGPAGKAGPEGQDGPVQMGEESKRGEDCAMGQQADIKKSTWFFEISSLLIVSLACLPHWHPENRNIFLSSQDEICVFIIGGMDSLRGYIAGNQKCSETDK